MQADISGGKTATIMPQTSLPDKWGVVTIVGVGLIGGSVGKALCQRQLAERVIGVGRQREELELAQQRNIIHEWTHSIAEGVSRAELVVVCVPVDQIAGCICEAAGHMPAGSLITDVGSTKRNIISAVEGRLPPQVEYVPAHPLAGSEKSGARYAHADLFRQRRVILTPTAQNTPWGVARIRSFWAALGAEVLEMTAEDHDRMAAAISHLPHVLAASLVLATPAQWLPFAASGFRDTTRIAAGDAQLWSAILQANRDVLQQSLEEWERQLVQFRRFLETDDGAGLREWLAQAQRVRYALGSGNPTDRT
jgi:prephenate dehydrogenase